MPSSWPQAGQVARALLKRGQDEVRGDYISYDARSEFFQVTGGPKTATPGSPGGRARLGGGGARGG